MATVLVTGGGGYVGNALCHELSHHYGTVLCLDVHFINSDTAASNIRHIKCDIRDVDGLYQVFGSNSISIVFHVASYGMSGRDMFKRSMIESVNVTGTSNIIQGCIKYGVPHLVYTSTYNVVFGGQIITNGDESLPYFPLDQHVDHYSRTKSMAEQLVLASHNKATKHGVKLCVCALRCAGIYGEGEMRHLPRIVNYIKKGLFAFKYGEPDNKVDFLHVDNFVQAHTKAGHAIQQEHSRVAGKVYFVSDGAPVNNFEFFRPLVEGLGYTFPSIRVPVQLIYYMAFLIEILYASTQHFYKFQPLLTRAEVYKTGVTHYFSIAAARRDFDYRPLPRDLSNVVKWYIARGHYRNTEPIIRKQSLLLVVLVTFAALYILTPLLF